jgi:hypothetical protein
MPDQPSHDLPQVIAAYQDAHDRHDTPASLATFTTTARVADDGHEYVGTDEIRTWLDTAASEYEYTRTQLGADVEDDGSWIVRNRVVGNFPGGTVDLAYRFVLDGDLIAELVIAP